MSFSLEAATPTTGSHSKIKICVFIRAETFNNSMRSVWNSHKFQRPLISFCAASAKKLDLESPRIWAAASMASTMPLSKL